MASIPASSTNTRADLLDAIRRDIISLETLEDPAILLVASGEPGASAAIAAVMPRRLLTHGLPARRSGEDLPGERAHCLGPSYCVPASCGSASSLPAAGQR
jgi:hypothetical protein